MDWRDREECKIRLAQVLQAKGWQLLGYNKAGEHDLATQLDQSYWEGVALHPDHPGVVVVVDISPVNCWVRCPDWPAHLPNPDTYSWHVEKNGQVLAMGRGLLRLLDANRAKAQRAGEELANRMLACLCPANGLAK